MSSKEPTFGKKIKELRKAKKLTQEQIAAAIGCTIKTYRTWEKSDSAKIRSEYLDSLVKYFNVDMDYLTGRIDGKTHEADFVCEYTGLSESAVNMLHSIKSHGFKNDKTLYVLNLLLSDPRNEEFSFYDSGYELYQPMHNKLIDLIYSYLLSDDVELLSVRKPWPKNKVTFFGASEFVGLDPKPLYKEHLINMIREELNKYANEKKDNGEQK